MSLYKNASLAMIPTAYKDGKLYSIRPTDGSGDFTFSRGSNLAATRVASSGYIEKGRENLLLQSNNFNTTWTTNNSSVSGGQTGYDGSSDAWEFEATSTSSCNIIQNISQSGVQNFSIYAKSGTTDWLRVLGDATTNYLAFFDLTNGVVGATLGGANIDASITDVGAGWYRCSISGNASITRVIINIASGNNDISTTIGDNIYIQDAQLEQGLVATDYIETGASTGKAGILEDMPRLDYSGGATCPSLLLEPQRSNLVDDYSGYTWDAFNGAAISFTGTQQSPEGLNNAVTWTFGGTSGEVVQRSSISISNTTAYTISGYFKLTSGTLTSGSNQLKGLDGLTGGSVSLNTLTSEWQRLSFSVTSSSTTGRVQLRCDNSATIQVYGLQLEAGSYETSIIPTFGSAVTRSSDKPDTTFTSSIDSSVGFTILGEFKTNGGGGTSSPFFEFKQASGEYLGFGSNGVNWRGRVRDGSTNELHTSSASILSRAKLAVACDGDGFSMYANGTQFANGTTDFSALTSITSLFKRDTEEFGSLRNYQIVIFPSRLTETELASLTTL